MSSDRSKAKRIRPRVGDIFKIPLPDGRYAYGKVFRDASVGIFDEISDSPAVPPLGYPYAFIVGLYGDILRSGMWPIVGHERFDSEAEEWPPPRFIKDALSGEYSMYFKGEIKDSTEEECQRLEEAAVWDAHHVIERILRSAK